MIDDDIMPNDGYFVPREPLEQRIARKKEKAKTLEGLNILKDVVERLQQRIDFYNSVDSIPDEVKTDPAKFMHLYSAYKLTRDTLISEKEIIESLIDANAPNR